MAFGDRKKVIGPAKKVKKGTLLRMIKYFLKDKICLFFILIGMIGSTVISVGASLFLKVVIDNYIEPMLLQDKNNVDFGPFSDVILKFSIVLIIGVLCSVMYKLLMVRLSNGILRDIREQMYKKMQSLPL